MAKLHKRKKHRIRKPRTVHNLALVWTCDAKHWNIVRVYTIVKKNKLIIVCLMHFHDYCAASIARKLDFS